MDQTVAQGCRQGLISDKPEGVADATGLSADGRSSYYAHKLQRSKGSTKKGSKSTRYPITKWPKINAIADTQSHMFIAASVSEGPSHDSPELPALLQQASRRVQFDRLLADAGYDSEEHHRLARQEHGIRSTVIALNQRNQGQKWPKTKYRRQMKQNFHVAIYGNRWQVESIWSRHKRRLGWVLSSKSVSGQISECQNRIVTHNLMLLAA
jgi:transposase